MVENRNRGIAAIKIEPKGFKFLMVRISPHKRSKVTAVLLGVSGRGWSRGCLWVTQLLVGRVKVHRL